MCAQGSCDCEVVVVVGGGGGGVCVCVCVLYFDLIVNQIGISPRQMI